MIKTPKFWDHKGFIGNIFIPFSVIYFFIKRLINLFKPEEKKFKFITIFVGNIVAGGAGKTPICASIANILKTNYPSKKLCIISKGYGGSLRKPTLINQANYTAAETGDEPKILEKFCDVIVAKDRLSGAKFAEENNYELVIFDDGIHDNRIFKDVSLLVIDGKYGIGNGLLMPAGPLRDRLDLVVKSVSHIIFIGNDDKKIKEKLERKKLLKPNFKAFIHNKTTPETNPVYIAFAGIGRPAKFFDMLRFDLKLNIAETISFPDHYYYENNDLEYIKYVATKHNAKILTTEKDYVKLPDLFKKECEFIEIEVKFENKNFEEILDSLINKT